jgi:uncharacterized protein (TIGR03118 family)
MKRLSVFPFFLLLLTTTATQAQVPPGHEYTRVNLVSDIAGVARFTDPNLVNPWGLVSSSTSPFWISDNNAGVSTLYNAKGQAFPINSPLIVTIPAPGAPTGGTPTGVVFNGTSDFVISQDSKSAAALFIFATEDGTILGWNPNVNVTNAVIAKPASGGVYKGLAIASTANGNFIYATNFFAGVIEMYDKNFHLVKTFTDMNVDMNFAPFGIQNIDGNLWVTFALQKLPDKHDDAAGPGNGYVDVFDAEGTMIRRFATKGTLNSPWGLAVAPPNFGPFSGDVLVGNFGDGRINAFDSRGNFEGQLIDPEENPMTINGLWALRFGSGSANNGDRNQLFFTAGIADESHGLFGFIGAGANTNGNQ